MILLTVMETTAALHTTHRHHPWFIMNIHHTPCMNHMITLNMITPCILSCLFITKNPNVILLRTAMDTIAAHVMILLTAMETTAALHTTHRHHPFIMNIHHTPCMNHMITLNMITPCILSCLFITKNPNVILLRTAMDTIAAHVMILLTAMDTTAALYTLHRYHLRYPKNPNVIHRRTAKDTIAAHLAITHRHHPWYPNVIHRHTALATIAVHVMILLTAMETTAALHTIHLHHLWYLW
mmetsp:Transcript_53892/g.62229  ORF Transcript_53892/g.62229 Transcript_53892/m.62229 type:complete len:239 (-) Transcript_53892:35-751(-)